MQPNIRENGAVSSFTLKQYKLLTAYTDLDSGPNSILNSLGQSTGHKEAIGMPTLHVGSRSSEELIPKVKGCTFIVMGDILEVPSRDFPGTVRAF